MPTIILEEEVELLSEGAESGEQGFDGLVMSDWESIRELILGTCVRTCDESRKWAFDNIESNQVY